MSVRAHSHDGSLMLLNLMGASHYRRNLLNATEIIFLLIVLLSIVVAFGAIMIPEFNMIAECRSITGGDICYLNLK